MILTTTSNQEIIRTSVDDIKRQIAPIDFEIEASTDTIKIPLHKVGLLHTALLIDPVARTARIITENADYINTLLSEQDKIQLLDWLDYLTIHRTPQAEIKRIMEKETTKRKKV